MDSSVTFYNTDVPINVDDADMLYIYLADTCPEFVMAGGEVSSVRLEGELTIGVSRARQLVESLAKIFPGKFVKGFSYVDSKEASPKEETNDAEGVSEGGDAGAETNERSSHNIVKVLFTDGASVELCL